MKTEVEDMSKLIEDSLQYEMCKNILKKPTN